MGPECFCLGSFGRLYGSGVGGLVGLGMLCGIAVATKSFEVMKISQNRKRFVLIPC